MYRELAQYAESATFTYVRGLAPADLVARWGGDIATFSPRTFDDLAFTGSYGRTTAFLAVASIGDWTLAVDDRAIGVDTEMIRPLSAGTRVVSHYLQEITGIYDFRWAEDGRIEFGFYSEDGFISGDPDPDPESGEPPTGWGVVPEAFASILARSDALFPDGPEINDGPVFTWTEDLTGITLTPPMLFELPFVVGRIPVPSNA
ncbi:hypothetical protein FDA94_12250 [Herbidospora galbida]|uniref:Uncharacterized protein n=1 Tax=Herbidospora galbida TaxID=2575442 RepID=A0A4U3MJT1_9ACTN|nr:DUF6461 domain-containing protein [Herbidospora galbida]TKK88842.1 hypothetical protein FDA94_12250 [Herbidospora galbida]